MATEGEEVRLGVSVYLLKKSKRADAQKQLQEASDQVLPLADDLPGGALLVLPAEAVPPKWLKPVSILLAAAAPPELEGQSPGAILWVPRGEKVFLFTFGYGHTKVRDEWVEPDFGKVVALAVVPQGMVREMRAEQVFAKRHIASERAPRAAAVREFGFEADRDLVSAVEGVPEAKYWPLFGLKVRGGVSFKFELSMDKVVNTLDLLTERFDSNDHLQRWPQINTLSPVRDDDVVLKLGALLEDVLSGPHPENAISMAAPGERSGDQPHPQHFVIGRMSSTPSTSPYLTFPSWRKYVEGRGDAVDVSAAVATKIHLLDEEKNEIGVCSMYACMGVEVSLDGVTHVLSSGSWYSADSGFIARTNVTLAALVGPAVGLCGWNQTDHEGPYNVAAAGVDATLWLFDKELVTFGGGASRFEYCDLMHLPTKTLYFVKHPVGSAGVSHLCEQVRRTAELFFDPDPGYREKLAERIDAVGKGWDTSFLSERPKQHEWNLCLVLMGKHVGALPFFAKCGIARLLGELQRRGFNVSFQAV